MGEKETWAYSKRKICKDTETCEVINPRTGQKGNVENGQEDNGRGGDGTRR